MTDGFPLRPYFPALCNFYFKFEAPKALSHISFFSSADDD